MVLAPPAVESFLDPLQAREVWPARVTEDESFIRQLEERRELNGRLQAVLANLPRPDISLQQAIRENRVTESQAAELYASLSDLLTKSPEYRRIVLYLPFELLPDRKWKPSSEVLQHEAEQFRAAYMASWDALLSVQDVRANFVDGDVPEEQSRTADLPRVVKAAHLIPQLVERGYMGIEDVLQLMETSADGTLKHSIADTLPVLADLGFLHDADLTRMEASDDILVRNMAILIKAAKRTADVRAAADVVPKEITLSSLQHTLRETCARIEKRQYGNVTKKRHTWLRQEEKRKAIESAGDEVAAAILRGILLNETVLQFTSAESDTLTQQALVDGIRKAVEVAAHTNDSGQKLYAQYSETLHSLWQQGDPAVHETLVKTYRHLHELGIVDDAYLSELGITVPKLEGPFFENLKMMKTEARDIHDIVTSIELNSDLARCIYPVVLVFGSRLKGYGTPKSDIDAAILVRPGVPPSERGALRGMLQKTFSHEKIRGEIFELWLEETDSGLGVRDFDDTDTRLGHSSWTHLLFGAAWEGNVDTIQELREKLLVPYLYDSEKKIHGRAARDLYLEEMERDSLQYRLMHNGYERFYPARGGMHTPHADQIDGQSVFWDSGYRQMATKLFVNRVFLPKMPPPKT